MANDSTKAPDRSAGGETGGDAGTSQAVGDGEKGVATVTETVATTEVAIPVGFKRPPVT
jgi:hypothetical protein